MFGCQFIFSCLFLIAFHVSVSFGDELSQKQKDQIVSMHNKIRSDANQDMPKLEWNDELASKAEQWAQNCDWSHNPDRSSTFGTLGENSAINKDPIVASINDWEKEGSDWTYGNSDKGCTAGKSCGHYTQMVTAATTKIGCGVATCSTFTSSEGDDMTGFDWYSHFVCDYYKAGNMPGEPPY